MKKLVVLVSALVIGFASFAQNAPNKESKKETKKEMKKEDEKGDKKKEEKKEMKKDGKQGEHKDKKEHNETAPKK